MGEESNDGTGEEVNKRNLAIDGTQRGSEERGRKNFHGKSSIPGDHLKPVQLGGGGSEFRVQWGGA